MRGEPVMKKSCAGTWFTSSVFIERMRVTSSSTVPRCGRSSEIIEPFGPCGANSHGEASTLARLLVMLEKRRPFTADSGIGVPLSFFSVGLWSKRSSCDGPPVMFR